jgi:NADH dehydrogenase (ubiquinone) 1 alpha subcomplex subunit 6
MMLSAINWADAQKRVLHSYREWLRAVRSGPQLILNTLTRIIQAPEVQTMYSLNIPVARLRTKMRQEFERHRYVNQIGVVDMLLFQSHAEYQVR